MDFDKIMGLFQSFIDFIQKLLKGVGVITDDNEAKAEGYEGDIKGLIDAIKGALDK